MTTKRTTNKTVKKPTTVYGQEVLDIICAHVAKESSMGHIGWGIGKTATVVRHVAKKIGKPVKSVAGAIAELVEQGYLQTSGCVEETYEDDYEVPDGKKMAITHHGWLAFSGWDAKLLKQSFDMSQQEWVTWDGINGTPIPYNIPPAFGYK